MSEPLSKHASRFMQSPATITTGDHLALIDRDLCAKGSALRQASNRFIVYDCSARYFGEWQAYDSEAEAEYVTARGIGVRSNGGYKGKQ